MNRTERNERLRAYLRSVIDRDFEGNRSAAARRLGLSAPAILEFERGTRGAGMKLLTALSEYSGLTIDEIASGRNRKIAPTLAHANGWRTAVDEAKRRGKHLPSWVWDDVALASLAHAPDPLTAEYLIQLAHTIASHAPDETAAIAAEIEELREGKRSARK